MLHWVGGKGNINVKTTTFNSINEEKDQPNH